jgi:hypothetical protein
MSDEIRESRDFEIRPMVEIHADANPLERVFLACVRVTQRSRFANDFVKCAFPDLARQGVHLLSRLRPQAVGEYALLEHGRLAAEHVLNGGSEVIADVVGQQLQHLGRPVLGHEGVGAQADSVVAVF